MLSSLTDQDIILSLKKNWGSGTPVLPDATSYGTVAFDYQPLTASNMRNSGGFPCSNLEEISTLLDSGPDPINAIAGPPTITGPIAVIPDLGPHSGASWGETPPRSLYIPEGDSITANMDSFAIVAIINFKGSSAGGILFESLQAGESFPSYPRFSCGIEIDSKLPFFSGMDRDDVPAILVVGTEPAPTSTWLSLVWITTYTTGSAKAFIGNTTALDDSIGTSSPTSATPSITAPNIGYESNPLIGNLQNTNTLRLTAFQNPTEEDMLNFAAANRTFFGI